MLSNTATPYYYGLFRQAVLDGKIPVCKEIGMEMNRIDKLIADPNIYYDPAPVEGYIQFCENELTLTDGSPLKLLDHFKLWAEEVFSWYYYTDRSVYVPDDDYHGGHYVTKTIKHRLTNKQYIIVARGTAKTLYDTTIHAYFQNVDCSTTDQVCVAPTVPQAVETITPLLTAVARARGPLLAFLTEGTSTKNTTGGLASKVLLAPCKDGLENKITNSIIRTRPMSIDKLQGLRSKIATVDEWLSCPIREDVVGAIEQGACKNPNYLIIATSSEGTVRNGSGDTIKMELMSILKGEYYQPHISIWHYKLDDIKEVGDPQYWIKACPSLGNTVTYETYQLDVERAEKNPEIRNDILAKRFGLPLEGYTYFFTYEETLPHGEQCFWNMQCSLGIDLSQGDDFCSFTFLFPINSDRFGIKTRNYITEVTLNKLPTALRVKYEHFINEGSLIIMPEHVLDMDLVYEDLDSFITESNYIVQAVGYDPYNAKHFIDRWIHDNGPYGVEVVRQGAKTESVPLGELKTLAELRRLLFDEEIMTFAMGNCITLEDTNGNRKLYKKRRESKIDPVAALIDAYHSYKINKDFFE